MSARAAASPARSLAVVRVALLVALSITTVGPLLLLVATSFSGQWFFPALVPTAWTTAGWQLGSDGARLGRALWTSVVLALATGVLASAIALPLGRAMAGLRGWRRHVTAAAAFLPVAAPPLALGTGLQVVLLRLGLGGTAPGVLVAHLVPAIGYLALIFLGTFTLFDRRVEEEARSLGATQTQTWRHITLPLLRPQIAEAMIVGFLISWSQFALTLVAGGGEVRALPLEIFAYVRAGQAQPAAVGALLLVIPPAAAFVVLRWAARRNVASLA